MNLRGFIAAVMIAFLLAGCRAGQAGPGPSRVNINNASAEVLKLLPGFNGRIVEELINYRLENGPFETLDDLLKVPGIDQPFLESNRDALTVEDTGGDTPRPAELIAGKIAFSREVNGRHQIFVQANLYAQPRQVTFGDFDASTPKWSPDGRRIAYIGDADSAWPTIYILDLESGKSQKQAEIQADFPHLDWFGDGLNLFYTWHTEDSAYQLFKLDTMKPVVGVSLSPEVQGAYNFDLSPAGSRLAIASQTNPGYGIKVINTSSWQPDPLWHTENLPLQVDFPAWSPGGDVLGYMDYTSSTSQPCFIKSDGVPFCVPLGEAIGFFTWLDSWHILIPVDYGITWDYHVLDIYQPRLGPTKLLENMKSVDLWFPAPSQPEPPQPEEQAAAEMTPTSKPTEPPVPLGKLLFRGVDDQGYSQIWLRESYPSSGRQLTSGGQGTMSASWAPDGSGRIVYRSFVDDDMFVFLLEQPDAPPKRISPAGCMTPSWTPDSQRILAMCVTGGRAELFLLNPDGSGEGVQLTHSSVYKEMPKISPDGSRLAFSSGMIDAPGIFVAPMDNPDQYTRLVTTDFYNDFEWSPESDAILTRDCQKDGCSLFLAGLDGSQKKVYSNARSILWMDWPANTTWVLFTMEYPGRPVESLHALDLAAPNSEPVLLAEEILGDIDLLH